MRLWVEVRVRVQVLGHGLGLDLRVGVRLGGTGWGPYVAPEPSQA